MPGTTPSPAPSSPSAGKSGDKGDADNLGGCCLSLTLHGSLGTSGPHRLHEPGRLPAAGEQLQLASVGSGGFGDLGKISLQLDSHRPEDQVHLASLRLSDLEQPLDFFFPLDCSLEAGQQAEFNASRPGVPQAVSLDYRVSLRLGSARNCGSSAVTSMRIVLHGDLGSSAPGRLLNLRLLPGQTVSRNVRCLSVGHLHSVTIGHEQRGGGQGVYLDSVSVSWRDRAPESRRFRCQRWLDSAWGDGQTQATLTDSAESSDGEKKQPGDLLYELEVHAEPLQRLQASRGLRVRLHPNAKDDAATAATADSLPAAPLKRHQLQVDDVNDSQRQRCLYTFRYPQLPRVAALSLWEDSEDFEDEDKGGEVTDIDGVEEAAAAEAVTSTPLAVTRLRLLQDHRDRFAFVCSRPAQLRVGGGPPTRFALLAVPTYPEADNGGSGTRESRGRWRVRIESELTVESQQPPAVWAALVTPEDGESSRQRLGGFRGDGVEDFELKFENAPDCSDGVYKVRLGLELPVDGEGGDGAAGAAAFAWRPRKLTFQDLDTEASFESAVQLPEPASGLRPGNCLEIQADWPGALLLPAAVYLVRLVPLADDLPGPPTVWLQLFGEDVELLARQSSGRRLLLASRLVSGDGGGGTCWEVRLSALDLGRVSRLGRGATTSPCCRHRRSCRRLGGSRWGGRFKPPPRTRSSNCLKLRAELNF
ncbi:hypothetical protein BOX15_Mlig022334g3 [Macrostomum lignano]|uniref:PLAT domain-containing protein n=1 Tax=Macrostomum lignano TaxID=282301 RepID=A0A267FUV8_9PLAT|nr:hypothetical protein BOX15_Mlig022334g3 [Macrostomum lignano]